MPRRREGRGVTWIGSGPAAERTGRIPPANVASFQWPQVTLPAGRSSCPRRRLSSSLSRSGPLFVRSLLRCRFA
jgi:hypothetical protein